MIYFSNFKSPIWDIKLVAENNILIGLYFVGQKNYLSKLDEKNLSQNDSYPVFIKVKNFLADYFDWKNREVDFKIKASWTDFQEIIWQILLKVPYWETKTYSDIAEEYAKIKGIKMMSPRWVWNAVWKNPISIIIPCHRVVWKNNKLIWFASGLDKKEKLLKLENIILK